LLRRSSILSLIVAGFRAILLSSFLLVALGTLSDTPSAKIPARRAIGGQKGTYMGIKHDRKTIGGRIYFARVALDMTQGELAAKLHVSRTTIKNWETNKNRPSLYGTASVARVLGLTVAELEGV
jgi:DNA-binding XRE family transcriptional regulator